MAGDWIKMRGSLLDHPKVIAITRLLMKSKDFREWLAPGGSGPASAQIVSQRASRSVTVASLMCVWSNARAHGKFVDDDLHLPYSTIDDLDEFAGVPTIGRAMFNVGWAEEREGQEGIFLPRFKEFNVPMSDAERAKGYRSRRPGASQGVTESSRDSSHKRRDENGEIVTSREEKRRIKTNPPTPLPPTRPETGSPPQPPAGAVPPEAGKGDPGADGLHHATSALSLDALQVGAGCGTEAHERAGSLFAVLKANGCKGTPQHPQVLEWVRLGVSVEQLREAIAKARETKPPTESLNPAYLAPIVERVLAGKANGSGSANSWLRDEAAAIAKGRELGIEPKPGEEWQAFRQRITAKLVERSRSGVQ